MLRLLPVMDDYERALQYVPDVEEFKPWTAGVEMVYRNFKGVLESIGVTQIQALGMGFDPTEHESVSYRGDRGFRGRGYGDGGGAERATSCTGGCYVLHR